MPPKYTLEKIKFGTGAPTFEKVLELYEGGKVTKFREELNGYFAVVAGTHEYNVYVEKSHYDRGDCDCYLGQHETLCKHMVAVAIYAAMGGKELSNEDKQTIAKLFLKLNADYYAGLSSAVMFRTVGDYLRYALSKITFLKPIYILPIKSF
ncbi:MAG: hypothetical protein PHI53_00630 [Candidatus Pacebacteria bacterium]|nr:hypothetical protein [Candidatus Paceibacterota bacterium]